MLSLGFCHRLPINSELSHMVRILVIGQIDMKAKQWEHSSVISPGICMELLCSEIGDTIDQEIFMVQQFLWFVQTTKFCCLCINAYNGGCQVMNT